MLARLCIKNFAIIDNLEIDFKEGFNVISGETGAGKSIIFGALEQVLGARASKTLIKKNCDKAIIQAVFDLEESSIKNKYSLDENGKGNLIIVKEILQNSKTYSKVNGEIVTQAELREVSACLISVFGQDDRALIFQRNEQLKILDTFLSKSERKFLEKTKTKHDLIKELETKLENLPTKDGSINRELDLIEYQIADIDEIDLKTEDNFLEDEYLAAKNSEENILNLSKASYILKNDESDSVYEMLNKTIALADNLKESLNYEKFQALSERLTDILYELSDISSELRNEADRIDDDPEKLYEIEKRRDQVNQIKQKYGSSVKEVLEFRDELEKRKNELTKLDITRLELEKDIKKEYQEFNIVSSSLREIRKKHASFLQEKLEQSLKDLSFVEARVKIEITDSKQIKQSGKDDLEFFIKLNSSSEFQELRKVASGGEISRIMLAIFEQIANVIDQNLMIFDEIDTGLSGIASTKVARKMYSLGKKRQIIAISHSLELLMYADYNLKIIKHDDGNETNVVFELLDKDGVLDEVYRLISVGEEVPELREQAKTLLDMVGKYKNSIQ